MYNIKNITSEMDYDKITLQWAYHKELDNEQIIIVPCQSIAQNFQSLRLASTSPTIVCILYSSFSFSHIVIAR